jgi:4-aminobutyrate aminotransferase
MANDLLPLLVTPLPGPRAQELVKRDQAYISSSYTRDYPLVVDRAKGAVVWDVDDNRYLDFNAGIAVASTGHCHPEVVQVVQEQAARLIHMGGTDFYYKSQADAAQAVSDAVPIEGPKRVFLANSGAEAVECALKLARYNTGRRHIISFHGAFHGRTMGALSLTQSKSIHKRRMGPFLGDVTAVPYAYCYRCPVNLTYPGCNIACLDQLEKVVFGKQVPPEEVAAIFVEPIQGEGGYVPAPKEFLQRLRELTKKHGILLVFDEVQSGMGRTGRFFASEHSGVVADIYCIAKGVASGLPLGVTVSGASTMNWPPGSHANTAGGNPLALVAAVKTVELLRGGILANCEKMGERLMDHMRALASRSRLLGDVRGRGLMIGLEIVRNKETKEPAADLRDLLVHRCYEQGLLLLGCGANTLRLSPPLVVNEEQVDWAAQTISTQLEKIEKEKLTS